MENFPYGSISFVPCALVLMDYYITPSLPDEKVRHDMTQQHPCALIALLYDSTCHMTQYVGVCELDSSAKL